MNVTRLEDNTIQVYSTLNQWIDLKFKFDLLHDLDRAELIIKEAYDSYWGNADAECETVSDWICSKLDDAGIINYEVIYNEERK